MTPADLRSLQTRALRERDLEVFDAITSERMLGDGEIVNSAIFGACRRWRLYDCPLCGHLRHYGTDPAQYAACTQLGACYECWASDYQHAQRRLARYARLTVGGGIQRLAERYAPDHPQRDRYRQFYVACFTRYRRLLAALAFVQREGAPA